MYKSPIQILQGQMEAQLEGEVLRAVQKVGVDVDKNELLRALQYDRDQYEKGYADGKAEAVQQWIPVTERKPDLELVEVKTEDMDLFPCLVSKVSQGQCRNTLVTKAWWDGLHFIDSDCICITKYVTHWMPLPQPPKEG